MRNIGSGRTAATVGLVGIDADTQGQIRETLAAEAVLPQGSVPFEDAISTIKRTRPHVVMVGFQQGLDAPLALAEALLKALPGTTLVALADTRNADNILAAMRVGYKEYVVLPDDAQQLRQVVHDAAYAPQDEGEKGMVISIWGAKGGVGTTTLACHIAADLAAIHRVLCIDLDFSMGDLASVLDLNPKDNIIDLLPRAEGIDERMLTGATTPHRSKIHVLAQPGDLDPTVQARADEIYGVISAAAEGYQYVIIDCGTYMDEAVEMALNVADVIVVLCEPTVVSIRDAFRRIKLLNRVGIDKEVLRLVVNRASRTAAVSKDDIEQNLGMKVTASIPDDPKTVGQAANEGKLIREINRRSDVARAISSLVGLLTDEEMEEEAEEESKGGGFLFGLFSRG